MSCQDVNQPSGASRYAWIFSPKGTLVRIPVDAIRHFAGFRYGNTRLNPYQTFGQMLYDNVPLQHCSHAFADFLQSFRPRCFGSLFGDTRLLEKPLWVYPWDVRSAKPREILENSGWVTRAVDIPDVMTHFSTEGIPNSLLRLEAEWHQKAFQSISRYGYNPLRFSPIRVLEVRRNGDRFWIAVDGNHRLSALCASGVRSVDVAVDKIFSVDNPQSLPGVIAGLYSSDEVAYLFQNYLVGLNTYCPRPRVEIV